MWRQAVSANETNDKSNSVISEDIADGEGWNQSCESDYRLSQFSVSAASYVLTSEGSVSDTHAAASEFLLNAFGKMHKASVFLNQLNRGIAATVPMQRTTA